MKRGLSIFLLIPVSLIAQTIKTPNSLSVGTISNAARLNLGTPSGSFNEEARMDGVAGSPVFSISNQIVGSTNLDGSTNYSWQFGMNGGTAGQYDTNHSRFTFGIESRYIQGVGFDPQIEWYWNAAYPGGVGHRYIGGIDRWVSDTGAHSLSQFDFNVDQINWNSWDGTAAQIMYWAFNTANASMYARCKGGWDFYTNATSNGYIHFLGGETAWGNSANTASVRNYMNSAGTIFNTGVLTGSGIQWQINGVSDVAFSMPIAAVGIGSTAVDATVTIASTGWTNTFTGKNAVVYMDGVGLTFTVYNTAGTAVYTNSVALSGDTVILQPSGKLIITAGTLGVGRATPL